MSSFKAAPMRAMPWSLDELAMPDVFEDISLSVGAGAYNVRAAAIREAEQRAREAAAHEQAKQCHVIVTSYGIFLFPLIKIKYRHVDE